MTTTIDAAKLAHFRSGVAIPAHPLALTAQRRFDEVRQRALTRYYLAAGAGGVAVGVHTTQFEIRDERIGLLRPVLELASETVDAAIAERPRPFLKVAGAAGPIAQAVAEAELAAELGYDAVLLSPVRDEPGRPGPAPGSAQQEQRERAMIERARAVGEVLPVIGFYLQAAIGGPRLSGRFWRDFIALDAVIGVKAAPFDRYATIEVARALAASGRAGEVALYTGNDDSIVNDLIAPMSFGAHQDAPIQVVGGLLGHWSVWTSRAVGYLDQARAARQGDDGALRDLVGKAASITDANAALFDPQHGFAGCIAGVHEVLRRQGLMAGIWCLDPAETLSPGQADEITRVIEAYPWLIDDEFVAEHRDEWLR